MFFRNGLESFLCIPDLKIFLGNTRFGSKIVQEIQNLGEYKTYNLFETSIHSYYYIPGNNSATDC